MPISAEQWRVKTGMINASRGLRQLSMKPPPLLLGGLPPPPPSDWRGYILALTLLWLPLLYKVYELGVAVLVGLFGGESHGLDIEDSYGFMDPQLHCHSWSGPLIVLINTASYLVVVIAVFLMGSHECTERNKHQFMFLLPLHCQKFLCFDVENGVVGGSGLVPKVFSSCVYATFMMEQQSTLQCIRVPRLSVERTKRVDSRNTTLVSFVVQLSTIVLTMLLLLSGDVERNPGPLLSEGDIMILVTELKSVTSEYYKIGIRFGINPAKMEIIEQNHPNDCNAERRLTEVLLYWLRGNTDVNACWESVIDALIQVDRIILARELAIKYCPCKIAEAMAIPAYGHGKISFPTLDTSSLDDDQKKRCQKLSADMENISEKFQDLFDSISESLEERKIPAKKIVSKIRTFKAFEPVYAESDSRSILEEQMTDLRNAKSIDDVMFIIGTYSSFFNYHLVGRIIKSLGTENDLKMLSEYEEQYRLFAECVVYECPTTFQGPADAETQRQFMVKVDDTFEKCTESHLKRFINKLSEVLKLSEGTLSLESIRRGCLELTLQSPLFVFQSMFPLSSDQERALAALGVIKVSAGDYQYPPISRNVDVVDGVNKGDGADDGDSGIGGTLSTIVSELSALSEEISSKETTTDPYDMDFEHEKVKTAAVTERDIGITPLHVASYIGKLDYIKQLIASEQFSLSQKDELGSTPFHYAVYGGQLNVMRYYINDLNYNPNDYGAFGEKPLHIACRQGDLKIVEYLLIDQMLDPSVCADNYRKITPLHSACVGGNLNIVRLLVQEMTKYSSRSVDTVANDRTEQNNTPIHFAALSGRQDIVKYFLTDLKCDANIKGEEGSTPLHCAAHHGHLNIVKYLIDTMKCNPSHLDEKRRTPLTLAAGSKSLETVKYLVEDKNCNPVHVDSNGNTPLQFSAIIGPIKIVKYFLDTLHCNLDTRGEHKASLLHAAAQGGNLQIIKYLTDEKHCDPTILDDFNRTPLHYAAECGHLDCVKFFIVTKKCSHMCASVDGDTPLHLAVFNGHIEVLKFYVSELKCNPKNIRCQHGATLLHVAAQNGHLEIMKYLIDVHELNPSQTNNSGSTPLHLAAISGKLDSVKYLILEKGCDPYPTVQGNTPLHAAVQKQQSEIVDFYIAELNCDPCIPGMYQDTPLHVAIKSGHLDMAKVLLKYKAKSQMVAVNSMNVTPVHLAAIARQIKFLELFIKEVGFDQNIQNSDGMTPLHFAASLGYFETVKFLISDLNSNPNIRNNCGETPLQLAESEHHKYVTEYLKKVSDIESTITFKLETIYQRDNHPPKPISSNLKEGDHPLQSVRYFPTFRQLPEEREFEEYYKQRGGVNWIFMTEITSSDKSRISGNQTFVRDRSGKDSIPILFCPDTTNKNFDFTSLKKGHTLIVQQATQHYFPDGTIGLYIELPSTQSVLIIPCSMKDLFDLSALYYKNKDTKCWSCGKTGNASLILKKCTTCKVAHYCSKDCQATDWKKCHRKWCKVMPHFMKLTEM